MIQEMWKMTFMDSIAVSESETSRLVLTLTLLNAIQQFYSDCCRQSSSHWLWEPHPRSLGKDYLIKCGFHVIWSATRLWRNIKRYGSKFYDRPVEFCTKKGLRPYSDAYWECAIRFWNTIVIVKIKSRTKTIDWCLSSFKASASFWDQHSLDFQYLCYLFHQRPHHN